MPTTKRDLQALHYLAQRLRAETYGAADWHDNGLAAVLAKLEGHNLAITVERVTRHAGDAEARTPAAIERPFTPDPPTAAPRQPAKAGDGDECRAHPGEWATSCRACASDSLAGDDPRPIVRQKPPAEVSQRGAAACRSALSGGPVTLVPLQPDEVAPLVAQVLDRPEQACAAPGCFRPTRDGICDRCREQAAAEDVQAANAELIGRLKAQQAERARTAPPPEPGPPRFFTSVNHERVHAAEAARTERSTP